jgi:hypothetical protein
MKSIRTPSTYACGSVGQLFFSRKHWRDSMLNFRGSQTVNLRSWILRKIFAQDVQCTVILYLDKSLLFRCGNRHATMDPRAAAAPIAKSNPPRMLREIGARSTTKGAAVTRSAIRTAFGHSWTKPVSNLG